MARKPRIHFPGAFYHVILRGNAGQPVFIDDADRCRFYLLRLYPPGLPSDELELLEVYRDLSKTDQNSVVRMVKGFGGSEKTSEKKEEMVTDYKVSNFERR